MLAQSPIPYEKIENLERLLLDQPQVLMPVEHDFCNGLYARTMRVQAGTIITGAIHRSENFLIVRQGRGVIGTLTGLKWFNEGDMFTSKAGAKNFAYIEEDTVFTTFHSNIENDTDPELLWEKYTCAQGELEHEVQLMLGGGNMTFGLSAAAILGIGTAVAGVGSAIIGGNAAKDAAATQAAAAQSGIAEQDKQFQAMQKLLAPFVDAGTGSLKGQEDINGTNGNAAQKTAIDQIKNSSQFDALNAQGQDAILQNASATGGLRGGNTQAALAQFSPQLLNSLIQQHYQNLGGITGLGANAAAGVGNAGLQTGVNNANLLQQSGAAQAGGILAAGAAGQNSINSIIQGLGVYKGLGGTF